MPQERDYKARRQARKAIAYLTAYSAPAVVIARKEGVYPPVGVDLADLEARLLAERDPYGEDA